VVGKMKNINWVEKFLFGFGIGFLIAYILVGIMGCSQEPHPRAGEPSLNPGIFDCVCEGKNGKRERVACPNYIPKYWKEYCKTASRWQK